MRIQKSEWTPQDVALCNRESGGTKFTPIALAKLQPEFSIGIGWNEPAKLWKPFIVIQFWHHHIQLGWLY